MISCIKIGGKKNRLILLDIVSTTPPMGLFKCDCGLIKKINIYNVSNSHTKSCGCLNKEVLIKNKTTHGHCRKMKVSKEYTTWQALRNRCYAEKDLSYKDYGERGIIVCDRWNESFENFYKDMGDAPSKKHSIDRIDNNGNYEPSNCRWATKTEQNRNTRRNNYITYNGETKCVSEWAEIIGLSVATIYLRINRRKWSIEKAFSTPNIKENPKVSIETISEVMKLKGVLSQRQLAKKYNISQTWVRKLHNSQARPLTR